MAGITRPSHLLPSAHARPKPCIGDLSILDDYVDSSSNSETGHADAGGATGGEGGGDRSPSPAEDTGLATRRLRAELHESAGPLPSPVKQGKS